MKTADCSDFPIAVIDPDDLSERAAINGIKAVFRPPPGRKLIEVGSLSFNWKDFNYQAGYSKSGFELSNMDDSGVTSISLTTAYASMFAKSYELHSDSSTGIIVDSDRCDILRCGQSGGGCGMSISRDRIKRSFFAQTGVTSLDPVCFFMEFKLASPPGAIIMSIADIFYQGLVLDDILARSEMAHVSLVETLIEIILGGLPHNFSHLYDKPAPLAAPARLKRAVDYVHANAGLPLTVEDVAEVAHLTVRSLYASFRRYYNTTPKALIRSIRLQAVRRDIQAAGPQANIGDIARRWGFVHMGRFSHLYHNAFGELPSETDITTKRS